jgi:hypothetical protein
MAQQRTPMYMKDWIQRLDSILQLNGRELLTHAGKISHERALKKSGEEFEKYQMASFGWGILNRQPLLPKNAKQDCWQ